MQRQPEWVVTGPRGPCVYLVAVLSLRTLGVRKMSSSVLSEVLERVLNKLPKYGISPSEGYLHDFVAI